MVGSMSIDPSKFRQVLGHFPTGVTVITATTADGTPVGFTIGSFTSVSLDPPLVGFLPMVDSDRWALINTAGSFCVNVLGAQQADLCWRFAKSSIQQPFDGVEWHPSAITGSPIIDGAIAWIDCSIEQVVEAGDHHFVLGRVLEMEHIDGGDEEPNALLFFRGKIGSFHPHESTT
jgi:3-hydroxy-9,10-secoandrosta-1,3,5(10)-triene-9,17-dione monooxygenase reductase component